MKWRTWVPGDANLDGKVNLKDFYTLQGNWMQAGDLSDGDFNDDGAVDLSDFIILQANWLSDLTPTTARLSTSDFDVLPYFDPFLQSPQLLVELNWGANLDGDRDVDQNDLAILLNSYGKNSAGDTDRDGDTDGRDFLNWQRQFFEYDQARLTADFEVDAQVDGDDLDIWKSSYGKNRGGDADGDGDTDGRDFLIWQQQASAQTIIAMPVNLTVPEPETALLLLGLAPLGLRRKID
jgi:hypothetical protein